VATAIHLTSDAASFYNWGKILVIEAEFLSRSVNQLIVKLIKASTTGAELVGSFCAHFSVKLNPASKAEIGIIGKCLSYKIDRQSPFMGSSVSNGVA
jgi:hypothetical protein